jgi:hypothetical protein
VVNVLTGDGLVRFIKDSIESWRFNPTARRFDSSGGFCIAI